MVYHYFIWQIGIRMDGFMNIFCISINNYPCYIMFCKFIIPASRWIKMINVYDASPFLSDIFYIKKYLKRKIRTAKTIFIMQFL
jgi:hypothetical protein